MDQEQFDELAKRLASGVSRRDALRRVGGILASAALASLLPRRTQAAKPDRGNAECAHFCNMAYPPGRERGTCKSTAAKGEGPCYACGGPREDPAQCAEGCSGEFLCGGVPSPCGEEGQDCLCTRSTEGRVRCGDNTSCGATPPCTTSVECEALLGPGAFCQAPGTGCCGQVCVPACGTLPGSGGAESGAAATGMTNAGQ
jgi:hypothetical protein